MARTKQTARKSTGGSAPQRSVAYANWSSSSASKAKGKKGPTNASGGSSSASSSSSSSSVLTTAPEAPVLVNYDLSYESVFYQHYFDVGTEKEKVFAPTYRVATTVDPYILPSAPADESAKKHWVHCYFNSCLDGTTSSIVRPNLHLVIALDISGSMSIAFDGENEKSKIQVAKDSLLAVLRQLRPEDSFGLVVFNHEAHVIQPLKPWKDIERVELEKQITRLRADGGTTISSAIDAATKMFTKTELERLGYSNRVFFMTDLQVGAAEANIFKSKVDTNAANNLWSTVVGIGLDLTQDIIEKVSKTPGCNYCNVRSTATFVELMDNEFAATVSPIAFNIQLSLNSTRYRIVRGYGTPEVNGIQPGTTVTFSTEFPSLKNDKGETRSGVILFQVEDRLAAAAGTPDHEPFKMTVKWDDISGIRKSDVQSLTFAGPVITATTTSASANNNNNNNNTANDASSSASNSSNNNDTTNNSSSANANDNVVAAVPNEEFFENSAVRKAIILVRFTNFLKKYLELRSAEANSETLGLFTKMRNLFPQVVSHFRQEMGVLADSSLNEELTNLTDMAQMDDIPLDVAPAAPAITTTATSSAASATTEASSSEKQKRKAGEDNNENNENDEDAHSNKKTRSAKASKKGKTPATDADDDYETKLKAMSRAELQALAREKGVKANDKTDKIIKNLLNAHAIAKQAAGDDSGLCCICLVEQRSVILYPCNHACVCTACVAAHTLTTCPLCRSPVDRTEERKK